MCAYLMVSGWLTPTFLPASFGCRGWEHPRRLHLQALQPASALRFKPTFVFARLPHARRTTSLYRTVPRSAQEQTPLTARRLSRKRRSTLPPFPSLPRPKHKKNALVRDGGRHPSPPITILMPPVLPIPILHQPALRNNIGDGSACLTSRTPSPPSFGTRVRCDVSSTFMSDEESSSRRSGQRLPSSLRVPSEVLVSSTMLSDVRPGQWRAMERTVPSPGVFWKGVFHGAGVVYADFRGKGGGSEGGRNEEQERRAWRRAGGRGSCEVRLEAVVHPNDRRMLRPRQGDD